MADTHPVQISIGATLAASLGSAVRGAQAQLNRLGSTMAELGNRQSGIHQLVSLRGQARDAALAMRAARQKVTALEATIANQDSAPTAKQMRELERARTAAAKAEEAYRRQRAAVDELTASLQRAGVNTRSLGAESARLGSQLEMLRARTDALTRAQQAQARNLEARSAYRAQMMDAVALGAALVAPVRTAMRFEQAMAEVGAVARASSDDLARLTAQARELGAKTNWSASQAAEGMKFLAMAGFNTEQTLAAMPGMLNLASAGAIDLGRAADIASNILSGFNLEAKEMGRVGDVLTNTFTASNTNLEMLGESMKYVAPVAAATNTSLEATAAMIGKLGDAGIQGSMAGTALRAILNRIAAPSGKAAELFAQMGVATRDAAGNMRPVADVLADIARATQLLGTAERSEVISTLFGLEAASAATVLVNQAASGSLQSFAESLKEAGSATRVAERQNETATGAMKRLGSAIESLAISIGNVLLPPLASLADRAAVVIGALSNWADRHPVLTQAVVGTAAAAIALKIATIGLGYAWTFVKGPFLAANTAIASARAGLALMQMQAQGTAASAGLLSLAWRRIQIGALGLLAPIKSAALAFWSMLPAIGATTAALLANPITWIVAGIGAAVAGLALVIRKYWDPIAAYVGGVFEGIRSAMQPAIDSLSAALEPLAPIGQAVASVFGLIADGVSRVVGWMGDLLAPVTLTQDEFTSLSESGKSLGEVIGRVLSGAFMALTYPMRAVGTLAGWAADALRALTAFSPSQALQAAWEPISGFFGDLWGRVLGGAQSAWRQLTAVLGSSQPLQALQSATVGMLDAMVQLPGQFYEAGRSILMGLARGVRDAAQQAVAAIGDVAAGVRDRFKSILGIRSPSRVFAALGGALSLGLAQGVSATESVAVDAVGRLSQSLQSVPMSLASPDLEWGAPGLRQPSRPSPGLVLPAPTSAPTSAPMPGLVQPAPTSAPMPGLVPAPRPVREATPATVVPGAPSIHFAPQITIHAPPGSDPQALADLLDSRLRSLIRDALRGSSAALHD